MVLVDGTVAISATRVCEIASHRALEETLATFARELSVVFSGALVPADDALDAGLLGIVDIGGCGGSGASVSGPAAARVVVVRLVGVMVVVVVVVSVAPAAGGDRSPRERGAGGRLQGVRRSDRRRSG